MRTTYMVGEKAEPLPADDFDWVEDLSKIDEDFIKNHDKNSDKGYILEVDVEYLKNLHDLHSDLPFLPKRIKIDKCSKLVCNLYDKKDHFVHYNKLFIIIKSLRQALNHGPILKKVHRVIQFNQKAWLKAYIGMNTELRKQTKNDFEEDFFKLINNDYFLNGLAEIKNSIKIDFNNLKYTFKDRNNNPTDSIGFKGPLHVLKVYIMVA